MLCPGANTPAPKPRGQVRGLHLPALGHAQGPFHGELQLAHVARPGVGLQSGQGGGAEGLEGDGGHLAAQLCGEKIHGRGDILWPGAQGGKPDYREAQAVIQVGAETAGGDLLGQVGVGGRHHPHVHLKNAGAADALEFLILDHPQHVFLEFEGGVADLVEEKGAPVDALKAAPALVDGPGEGAL